MKKCLFVLFLSFVFVSCYVKASGSRSYIDYPSNDSYYRSLPVSGWIMSDHDIDEIRAYIDDENVLFNYERINRPDVIKVVTEYKNTNMPGFSGIIDISNFEDGLHVLKIEFYSEGELVATNSKHFSIERKAKIYIDYPSSITAGKNINIQGWVLCNDNSYVLKTYIDDNEVDVSYIREKRDDVIKIVKGYGNSEINNTPGFNASFPSSNYSNGSHRLKISVMDKDNNLITSFSKSFVVEKYKSKSYIDYPTNEFYSGVVNISGWIMSTSNIDQIKAYIDDENVSFDYTRIKRPDVIKTITGYGNNEAPGFEGKIDAPYISDGPHKLKLEFISNDDVIKTEQKMINFEKKGKIYIDYPSNNVNGTDLTIQGWAMVNDASYVLKTYVDDKMVDVTYTREKRDDVIKAIKGFGDEKTNKNPGFKSKLDISGILNGSHNLKVDVVDKNGNLITSSSKKFSFNKYQSLMEIDNPISNIKFNGTVFNFKGWYLTHIQNTKLQVLIDDVDVSEYVKMVNRPDVIKVHGKKFNKTNNDTVGFDFNVNLTKFVDGNKIIIFNVIDNETGEIITTRKKTINLKKYKTYMDLNDPVPNFSLNGTQLKLRGWFISTSSSKKLQVLINNDDISDEIIYNQREDVYKVYGKEFNLHKNDEVGFNLTHDMTAVNDGVVNIKINVIDSLTNEIIGSLNRKINLKKYKTYMDLNDPVPNYTSIGTQLNLRGWFISTSNSKKLQILLDDKDVSEEITYYEREDVYKVYGNEFNLNKSDLVGFKLSHDVTDFKDGNVKIRINVIDNTTGEVLKTFGRNVNLKKYNGMLTIDYPIRYNFSKTSTLTVQGWELSELDNSKVRIFVDNKEFEVIREDREDVFQVYPSLLGGREMNEKPGFTSSIFLNEFSDGLHKVTIKLYSRLNELITEKSLNIFVYSNTYFGIDVSHHQGVIDWNQVGKSGIDFAILRVGYGSNFSNQDDKQFMNYVEGCVRNKIPFGVYLYSYANTVSGNTTLNNSTPSAESEAAHTLRILNKLNSEQKSYLKLPVFIDMEEDKYSYLGVNTLTAIADKYCDIIQANGYKCGVYANKNWLNNYLNNIYLSSKYDIWLAHYTDKTDYNGVFQIWQYSSSGHLAGINSSGLDMNISFKKYW